MYESLASVACTFHLYIFAFDDKSYNILTTLNLPNTTIIPLKEFENTELMNIKSQRTKAEYCWTCTPSAIYHVLKKYDVPSCTYLDADIYFFASPNKLLDELGNDSVLITDHNYSKEYDQTSTSGKYCVQFITFRNNIQGMKVLEWWKNACIDWCYAWHEDGKFGDQKYLDNWPIRFEGIRELKHKGGIAPWNIQQYFINSNKQLFAKDIATSEVFEVIFYHFHDFKIYLNGKIDFGNYKITKHQIDTIYKPYIKQLENMKSKIEIVDKEYNEYLLMQPDMTWKSLIKWFKRQVKRNYNVYEYKEFINGSAL